ncbi:MAG: carboxymuconolactone decarboxylase family protein [Caulobacterales bacterium]|nr:carboxymuconolactone decarboxylase family protein [Caulobacterales bacterium]
MPMLAFIGSDDCLIENELRPLIAYMASYGAGCRYCQAHNSQVAAIAGVAPEKIANLWRFEESDLFDERERAALAFAFAAGQQPSDATEADFDKLARHFSKDEMIDLAGIIGIFGFLNRWNDMMMTPLEALPAQTAASLLVGSGWDAGKHAGSK